MSEHFQYLKEGLVADLVDRVMADYHLDLEKALTLSIPPKSSENSPTPPLRSTKRVRLISTPTSRMNSAEESFRQGAHKGLKSHV